MSTLILALDFGTTTTVVCGDIQGAGNPRFLVDDKSYLIPSVIYKRNDGVTYYGKRAEKESTKPNGELIENMKMMLLDEGQREAGKAYIKEFLKEYIFKELFEKQKSDFPSFDNIIVRISHPSIWNEDLVNFMLEAVKEAGFRDSKIEAIPEPLAVSAYSLQSRAKFLSLKYVLSYNQTYNVIAVDMGGGTSDVVICKIEIDDNGKCKVSQSATYPTKDESATCGGREIDKILMHYCWEKCQLSTEDQRIFKQYDARLWKEQIVSNALEEGVSAEAPARIHDILLYSYQKDISELGKIDRGQFEAISSEHWKSLQDIIHDAVIDYQSKYGVGEEDIDFIFVTGGHSQWYCVKDVILKSCCFKKIMKNSDRYIDGSVCNPNETVARGLCSYDINLSIPKYNEWALIARLSVNGVQIGGGEYAYSGHDDALPFSFETLVDWEFPKDYLQEYVDLNVIIERTKGKKRETLGSFNKNIRVGKDWSSFFFASSKPILRIKLWMTITINLDNSFDIKNVRWEYEKKPGEGDNYEYTFPDL